MGGSYPVATAATPGFAYFRHASGTFVACSCLRRWLPVLERLAIAKGFIRSNLDIVQLTGDASASAGVHAQGGVFDVRQTAFGFVMLCREMGAPATWGRIGGIWTGNEHGHGVLLGCPHNAPAAYQLAEQRRGEDGLTGAGADPYPDPSVYRTWEQGIAWAEWQLSIINAAKELDMALTPDDIEKVAKRAADLTLWAPVFPGQEGMGGSTVRNHLGMTFRRADEAAQALAALTAKQAADTAAILAAVAALSDGVDVDPATVEAAAKAGAEQALAGLRFEVVASADAVSP